MLLPYFLNNQTNNHHHATTALCPPKPSEPKTWKKKKKKKKPTKDPTNPLQKQTNNPLPTTPPLPSAHQIHQNQKPKIKKTKQNPPKTQQTHSKNNQTTHYPPRYHHCPPRQPNQPIQIQPKPHQNPKSNPSKPKRQKLIAKNQTNPSEFTVPTLISPYLDHFDIRHAGTTPTPPRRDHFECNPTLVASLNEREM